MMSESQYQALVSSPKSLNLAILNWRAQLDESTGETAADGEVAAIAAVNNLTLVTRNTDDFSVYHDLLLDNWFE